MEDFNMKKKWIICIIIITIIYFVLSLCDFMYIPADKYPNIIRKMFFHDNEKATVRSIGRVCQTKEGIYFLYRGRLMYMNSVGTEVKEVGLKQIAWIIPDDSNVFFLDNSVYDIYKVNQNNETKPIIKRSGDRIYIDGRYIYNYVYDNNTISKYNLDGKKIYSSKMYYGQLMAGGVGGIIFNDYNMRMLREELSNYGMGVDVPYHYIFDWNRVKYMPKVLYTVHYYKQPSIWDYNNNFINLEQYDEWAEGWDNKIRENKNKLRNTENRNMEDYELVSIGLSKQNPDYYRAVDGYIYFYHALEFCYRDKNYKNKISFDSTGNFDEKEKTGVEFKAYVYVMFRVDVENIENARDTSQLEYEILEVPMYPIDTDDEIEVFEVNDNYIYSISNVNNATTKEIKVLVTDIEKGTTRNIYDCRELSDDIYIPGLYCSDDYVFLYQYKKIEESTTLRIIRLDKDGSNPILVMDENGEVVMKPIQ